MQQHYVALVPGLRFGDRELEVGEAVPIEAGRDYDLLLRRGDIGEAPEAESEPVPAEKAPVAKPKPRKGK